MIKDLAGFFRGIKCSTKHGTKEIPTMAYSMVDGANETNSVIKPSYAREQWVTLVSRWCGHFCTATASSRDTPSV